MYLNSEKLLSEIKEISNEIYRITNGCVVFEEYIALPYYGNIILRFELNKEVFTLDDLDKYESVMNEIAKDRFLIDFMGSVYKKVGLEPRNVNSILPKCYEKYKDEILTKSSFENQIKEDVQYLLELCGLSKDLPIWEIQLEEEINLFVLGKTLNELGTYVLDDMKINVYEIGQLECEGLMKATMYAKNHNISLVRALLEV